MVLSRSTKTLVALVLALLVVKAVHAADAPAGEPVASGSSLAREILKNISASFDTRFYGSSLATPVSSLRPDLNTGKLNAKHPLKLENKVSASYRIDALNKVGAALEFDYLPVREHGAVVKDPFLSYKRSRVAEAGVYKLDLAGRLYLGLTEYSRSQTNFAQVRFEQNSNWKLRDSRFSFNAYGYVHRNFYGTTPRGAKDYKFFLVPEVDYQIAPNLTALISYKIWASHRADRGLFDVDRDLTLLGPGLNWSVTRSLGINPYIDFSPGTRIALDTTTFGLTLWWGFL